MIENEHDQAISTSEQDEYIVTENPIADDDSAIRKIDKNFLPESNEVPGSDAQQKGKVDICIRA